MFRALDAGVNTDALRRSADDILRRMDQGWAPPPYAHMDKDGLRLSLGKAYQSAGDKVAAADHFKLLLSEPEPWRSQAAAALQAL